ncbi:Halomucin [Frankliniella fusca]|uniref:Halomucin n=1 Tax=Frankliniella fusca TaxID=407009 RepID=A0AAE1GS58_9NEOP|nr:Halomucin [Frankliniella fusca]
MSKRSKDMLKLSYDKLNLKLPDLPKVNPAPSPSKQKIRERLLDEARSDGTNLSVFSPSKIDLLSDGLSPTKKCQVWSQQVNKHYGVFGGMYSPSSCDQQEVDSPEKKAPPSTPGTPKVNTPETTPAKMPVVRRLVAYSPSAGSTSTHQSGSTRTNSPLKCSTVLELVASRRAAAKRQLAADSTVKDSVPCFAKDINENIQKPLTLLQVDSTCGRTSEGKEKGSSYQRSGSVITDSPLKQLVPKDSNKENESLKKPITSCQVVNCLVLTPSLTVDDSSCLDSTDITSLQNPSTNSEKTSKPVEGFRNLSAYQKLRMKNIAENEKCIREVIQNNPQYKAPEVLSPRFPLNDKTPRRPGNRDKRQNYSDEDVAFDKTLRSRKKSQNYSEEYEQSTLSDSDEDDQSEYEPDDDDQSEYQPDDDDQSEYQPDDDGQSAIHSDVDEQEKDKVPSANCEQDKDDNYIQQDPENPLLQITIQEPETQPRRGTVKERSERKMMWNSGKSFVRPNGEVVSAREWKPPHVCKISRKCHEHINEENGRRIFSEYWSLGDHNKRVAYVAARIEWSGIDRKRLRIEDSNREKEQNFKYFLEVNKKRIQVCRSTFLNTLSETDRFVRNVTANKAKSVSGITSDDARGRHKPTHSLQRETLEAVQKHIRAFPAYE